MTLHFTRPRFPDMPGIAVTWAGLRPFGGASLIVADPPWKFEDWSEAGNKSKSPDHHYACQPLDWIMALPLDVLAGPNCLLCLWATNPMLRDAFDVLEAWGFTYKTKAEWVKRTKNGHLGFGGGRRLRSSTEPVLIATRGNPRVAVAPRGAIADPGLEQIDVEDLGVTIEAALREHSRKPDVAYETFRSMVDGPAVELFAREARPGFIAWGNETEKFGTEKNDDC